MGTAHSRMEFEAFSGSILGLPKQERSHEGYVSVLGRRPIGSVGASEYAGRHSADQDSRADEEAGESPYTGGIFQRRSIRADDAAARRSRAR